MKQRAPDQFFHAAWNMKLFTESNAVSGHIHQMSLYRHIAMLDIFLHPPEISGFQDIRGFLLNHSLQLPKALQLPLPPSRLSLCTQFSNSFFHLSTIHHPIIQSELPPNLYSIDRLPEIPICPPMGTSAGTSADPSAGISAGMFSSGMPLSTGIPSSGTAGGPT